MLNQSEILSREGIGTPLHVGVPEPTISLGAAYAVVRRHRVLFALVCAPVVLAGVAYALLATPRYTATSVLLIDTRAVRMGQPSSVASAAIESANVDSQVEVLRSEGVIRSVVEALDLTRDPEFARRTSILDPWLPQPLKDWLGFDPERANVDPMVFAIRVMEKHIVVKRLGMSYVIQVDYSAMSAKRAAEIANRIVERYVAGQVEARRAAETSFNDWLRRRTATLQGEAVRTERMLADRKLAEATGRTARAYGGGEAPDRGAPLQRSLDLATTELARAARETAEIKELESAAQTSRALAETFARRLAEFVPQDTGPLSEARVISNALPPRDKSEPKAVLVIGAAIALGTLGGFGAAALREKTLRGIRSAAQLEAETGLRCLGMLARATGASRRRAGRDAPATADSAPLRLALDRPASNFAETMRTIQAVIRTPTTARPAQTIGVVSALPGEGKGVVAANLGHLCAASGIRTLLVDLDLRHAALSRALVPGVLAGIADVVSGGKTTDDVVRHDAGSGLDILPALPLPPTDAFGVLSSAALAQLITIVTQRYDLVILSLPAILPSADALVLAPLVDSYLVVVAWGATEPADVLQSLRKLPDIHERQFGVVLNGAPCEARREVAVSPGARPWRVPAARDAMREGRVRMSEGAAS